MTFDLKFAPVVTLVQCPICFHKITSFYIFLISRKSEAQDRRTDGRTDGVQRLMRPHRKGRIISELSGAEPYIYIYI